MASAATRLGAARTMRRGRGEGDEAIATTHGACFASGPGAVRGRGNLLLEADNPGEINELGLALCFEPTVCGGHGGRPWDDALKMGRLAGRWSVGWILRDVSDRAQVDSKVRAWGAMWFSSARQTRVDGGGRRGEARGLGCLL